MINSVEDIKKFINDNSFNKIFVLCGKKSFNTSGAEIFFKGSLKNKETRLFYKNSELPVLEELIEIINAIKDFKPDLILAVGGGAVIDYAKIANVVDICCIITVASSASSSAIKSIDISKYLS